MGPTVSQGDTYIFKYMKSARKRRCMVLQGNIIRVPDLGGWGSHSYGCFNQLRSEGWATLWLKKKKRERERRGDKVKSHVKLTGQTDSPKEPSRSYWGPSVATAQRVRGELRQASAGEEVKRLVVMPQAPISHYSCSIDIEKLSLPPLHTPLSGAGVGIWAVCWARSTTTYSGRCCDFTECVLCLTYLSP